MACVETSASVNYSALVSTMPWIERADYSEIDPSSLQYFLMKASKFGKNSRIYMITILSACAPTSFSS
jgi:hypothetical protein